MVAIIAGLITLGVVIWMSSMAGEITDDSVVDYDKDLSMSEYAYRRLIKASTKNYPPHKE